MPLRPSSRRRNLIRLIDIVQKLDMKALPYVIFMVVPVLGRMSDPDDDIRATATNTFASLVKMVPLEVSVLALLISPSAYILCRLVYPTPLASPRNSCSVAMKNVNS